MASRADRAAGAVLGTLIGDGLGFGMQWYYDLAEKEKDFGSWVESYADPKPDGTHFFAFVSKYRHEQGLRAGDVSQMAQVFELLAQSTAEARRYDRADFLRRLDELLSTLSGESLSGRYTDRIYIEARAARLEGKDWGPATASSESVSDGAVLSVVLAAVYADPLELAKAVMDLTEPLMSDMFIRQNSVVFALCVQALINGTPVAELGPQIKQLALTNKELKEIVGAFDNFLTPSYGSAARDGSGITVEPAKHIGLLFGMDCQLTHLLPCAYYLLNRFPDNFETAVLSASNGGGQNVVRAAMTGALCGAVAGLGAIPQRFKDGLTGGESMIASAQQVSALSP